MPYGAVIKVDVLHRAHCFPQAAEGNWSTRMLTLYTYDPLDVLHTAYKCLPGHAFILLVLLQAASTEHPSKQARDQHKPAEPQASYSSPSARTSSCVAASYVASPLPIHV